MIGKRDRSGDRVFAFWRSMSGVASVALQNRTRGMYGGGVSQWGASANSSSSTEAEVVRLIDDMGVGALRRTPRPV